MIIPQVSSVLFAEDYIYLFENDNTITDNSIIISCGDMYPEIYSGEFFTRSQIESTSISVFKTNETDLLEYVEWLDIQSNPSLDYEDYITSYITQKINNSIYSINIDLPEPKDNTTYGDTIGVYRYFNVDIVSGSIELFDTKKPPTSGFKIFIAFCFIVIFFVLIHKKKIKSI